MINKPTTKKLAEMSLEEARSMPWPFNVNELNRQPIGSLLDNGALSLRDMGFAVQRAYGRVREAARIILLHALSEAQVAPENAPGPLNVVSTKLRSYAERRQVQLAMLYGAVLGLIFMIIPLLICLSVYQAIHSDAKQLNTETSNMTGIIAFVVGLIIAGAIGLKISSLLDKVLNILVFGRLEKKMHLYRKGQLGEERVVNVMYSALDGQWWLFRNLELPGRRIGDLDLILVGPHGMYSFEVKAYSGEYQNVGERWEKRWDSKWHTVRKSPTVQARRNAAELSQLLGTNQIKQWITPVIIWANPESTVVLNNPSTPVWTLDQLSGCLKDLSGERPIPESQVEKIVDVLKKICQDVDAELE